MEWTFRGDTPGELPRMERVVALYEGGESWAVPFSALKRGKVAELEVVGEVPRGPYSWFSWAVFRSGTRVWGI